jgi:hypothetical protein
MHQRIRGQGLQQQRQHIQIIQVAIVPLLRKTGITGNTSCTRFSDRGVGKAAKAMINQPARPYPYSVRNTKEETPAPLLVAWIYTDTYINIITGFMHWNWRFLY